MPDADLYRVLVREFAARLQDLERVSPASDEAKHLLWRDVLRVGGVSEEDNQEDF